MDEQQPPWVHNPQNANAFEYWTKAIAFRAPRGVVATYELTRIFVDSREADHRQSGHLSMVPVVAVVKQEGVCDLVSDSDSEDLRAAASSLLINFRSLLQYITDDISENCVLVTRT